MNGLFYADQDIPQAWLDTFPLKALEATWNAERALDIKSISGYPSFASNCFISLNHSSVVTTVLAVAKA